MPASWRGNSTPLIRELPLPDDTTVRVTPSQPMSTRWKSAPIPWYHGALEDAPIHVAWNFRRSAVHQEIHNLGYRSADWAGAGAPRALDPLSFAIGGHDFFRIEGHLGRAADTVSGEIRDLIAKRNLPFQVQAVLLHDKREGIRVRPKFRYTPLHSLHYLVRQDVAFRLDESVEFGQRHVADVTEAVEKQAILGSADNGASVIGAARSASEAVAGASKAAAPVLAKNSYSSYKAALKSDEGANFKSSYAASLGTVSNARAALGHVSRTDFVSPFDGLINTNQPHWIDWLDDLIADQGDKADEKLLLPRFVQDHPGIDHLGGVWRGGTFVLVYDDRGQVVADFTLPYPAAEADAPEPEDPPLKRPPYRPPLVVGSGIRVGQAGGPGGEGSLRRRARDLQKDLDLHSAQIEGVVKGAFIPSNAVDPKKIGTLPTASPTTVSRLPDQGAGSPTRARRGAADRAEPPGLPADVRERVGPTSAARNSNWPALWAWWPTSW